MFGFIERHYLNTNTNLIYVDCVVFPLTNNKIPDASGYYFCGNWVINNSGTVMPSSYQAYNKASAGDAQFEISGWSARYHHGSLEYLYQCLKKFEGYTDYQYHDLVSAYPTLETEISDLLERIDRIPFEQNQKNLPKPTNVSILVTTYKRTLPHPHQRTKSTYDVLAFPTIKNEIPDTDGYFFIGKFQLIEQENEIELIPLYPHNQTNTETDFKTGWLPKYASGSLRKFAGYEIALEGYHFITEKEYQILKQPIEFLKRID